MIVHYDQARIGLFSIDTNKYKLPVGWIQEQKAYTIIGEYYHWYAERIYVTETGYWDSDGVRFSIVHTTFIGIHKSRLIRWLFELHLPGDIGLQIAGQQMQLFT